VDPEKKLAVSCRRMTMVQEWHGTRETSSEKIGRETMLSEEPQKEEKRLWKAPDTRQQLRLNIERTSDGFNRKTFRLELMKQAAGMSSGLLKVRDWTLWRSWLPAKWNKSLLAALA
jgi:hypothetical protein